MVIFGYVGLGKVVVFMITYNTKFLAAGAYHGPLSYTLLTGLSDRRFDTVRMRVLYGHAHSKP